jgi:hypothetical protein
MLIVAGLALVLGAAVGLARGGRPGNIGHHRLRAWWLVVVGFGLQAAADRLDLGSLATVAVLLGATSLLAFAALNPHLVGIGVVAVGVAANALVIGLDNGMPVRPSAVVKAHIASAADESALSYGYRHHRQGGGDRLVWFADIIPIPAFHEVVSFGDLILAVGVATAVAHLLGPVPRHASPADGDPAAPADGGSAAPADGGSAAAADDGPPSPAVNDAAEAVAADPAS